VLFAPEKLVYQSTDTNGDTCVVKYATSYNVEFHKLLQEEEIAPRLLSEPCVLPGNWLEIRMEMLDDSWTNLHDGLNSYNDADVSAVEDAVMAAIQMHKLRSSGKKMVWADARPANVMVQK